MMTKRMNTEQMDVIQKEDLAPFLHNKIGDIVTLPILERMTTQSRNLRFMIKLYPESLKPSCRGNPDGTDLPQRNEYYYYVVGSQRNGSTKYYFQKPVRKYNSVEKWFHQTGGVKTKWYIDSNDFCLYQADYDGHVKWTQEEYRVLFEPHARAWNSAVVDIDADGPIRSYMVAPEARMTPAEFSLFLKHQEEQKRVYQLHDVERKDGELLTRKRQNQRKAAKALAVNRGKRKRSLTPSPTFGKHRRKTIIAKTAMQRRWSTTKLKNPHKIVLIGVLNKYQTFNQDAKKLAAHTNLSVQYYGYPMPQVTFPASKLDYYRACCHQKGLHVVCVE